MEGYRTGRELIENEIWLIQQGKDRALDRVKKLKSDLTIAENALAEIEEIEKSLLEDKKHLEKGE